MIFENKRGAGETRGKGEPTSKGEERTNIGGIETPHLKEVATQIAPTFPLQNGCSTTTTSVPGILVECRSPLHGADPLAGQA
jgi:hypothetical protein